MATRKNQRDKQPQEAPQHNLLTEYVNWIVGNPIKVIVITVAMALAMGSGVTKLVFKKDYKYFFGQNNPQLINYENLQNVYNKNDNIIIAVESLHGDVFTPSILKAIEELTDSAWHIPYAIRVDSITNYQHSMSVKDDLYVADLIKNASRLTAEAIFQTREIALKEPLLLNRLINADGTTTGVNITLEMPGKELDEQARAVNYARELCRSITAKYECINTYVTGIVALDNAMSEISNHDMQTLIPLMFVGISLVIFILMRSVQGTLMTLAIIGLSTASAIGITCWFGIPITPPSAAAPIMIMTLAVADCIHILEAMFQVYRKTLNKREAVITSLMLNIKPVFLTSLTTTIGFLSLNFSDAPPLVDLGNISAIGVVMAFIFAVSTLPAMMVKLPVKAKHRKIFTQRFFSKIADFVIRRNQRILAICIPTICVLASLVTTNELNDQWIKYFDDSIKFRTDTEFVQKNLTGIYQIEFSISAKDTNGIAKPGFLHKIEQFEKWWYAQPNVRHVNSVCEIMRRLNKNMHGDDPAYYRIPKSKDLAAQYLILYEMSLPYGLDLNNQINIDKSSTRLIVTMNDIGTKELRNIALKGESWMHQHAPELTVAPGSGPSVMFSYISERNIKGMMFGILIGLLLITGTLVLSLGSIKYGLLSIIPNAVPAICAFGLWAIFIREINMAVSVVGAVTLGIVVDDTIHFLVAFQRFRKERCMDIEDAIRHAISKVGNAIVITSIALLIGFLTLSVSSFQVNSSMGQLSSIIIVFAIIADLILLPAFIVFWHKNLKHDATNLKAPLKAQSD
jgi:predicted RND superfamily exporter protein